MSEKCRKHNNNNNSDNPLTSRRIDGVKNKTNQRTSLRIMLGHSNISMYILDRHSSSWKKHKTGCLARSMDRANYERSR